MSLNVSVMAFEHEHHLQHLHDTLGLFGYRDLGDRSKASGENALAKSIEKWDLGDNRVLKAIAPCSGWTIIFDPEKSMVNNGKCCEEFSKKHSSRVVGMVCDASSQTYGFAIYDKGTKTREFMSVGGQIRTNIGDELTSEVGLNLKDKGMVDDDIFDIFLGATGVDLYSLLEDGEFTIKELEKTAGTPKKQAGPLEILSPLKFWE